MTNQTGQRDLKLKTKRAPVKRESFFVLKLKDQSYTVRTVSKQFLSKEAQVDVFLFKVPKDTTNIHSIPLTATPHLSAGC